MNALDFARRMLKLKLQPWQEVYLTGGGRRKIPKRPGMKAMDAVLRAFEKHQRKENGC